MLREKQRLKHYKRTDNRMKNYFKLEIKSDAGKEAIKHLIEEIPGMEVTYIESGLNWNKDKTIHNFMKTVITALNVLKLGSVSDVDKFSASISALRIQEGAYWKFISEGLIEG